MTISHAATTIQSSTSCGAGSTVTSSTFTNAGLEFTVHGRIANGGSAPSAGCTAALNQSVDGSTWFQRAVFYPGTAASTNYDFSFDCPADVMYAQVVFTGNTGNAVTVQAFVQSLTSAV
jgi:hypothetical protein